MKLTKKRWHLWLATVGVIAVLSGIILALRLESKPPFQFLEDAKLISSHEEVVTGLIGIKSYFKHTSYRSQRALGKIKQEVRGSQWRVLDESADSASYQTASGEQTMRISEGPRGVDVSIWTQRSPTILDRARLWMRKRGWVK